jgi:holin-like protein
MDLTSKATVPSGRKPIKKKKRRVVNGLMGLFILMALALAGGFAQRGFQLTLPGPVIGLALMAAAFVMVARHHLRLHRRLTLHLVPVSRLLVSHMGLLFVPAGVGIITEGDALRREWLPILAGLAGSTLIGLAATGWIMQRFSARNQVPKT